MLLAAAAQDDEGEGGAVNVLDSASAAGDVPEVTCDTPGQSQGTSTSIVTVHRAFLLSYKMTCANLQWQGQGMLHKLQDNSGAYERDMSAIYVCIAGWRCEQWC